MNRMFYFTKNFARALVWLDAWLLILVACGCCSVGPRLCPIMWVAFSSVVVFLGRLVFLFAFLGKHSGQIQVLKS